MSEKACIWIQQTHKGRLQSEMISVSIYDQILAHILHKKNINCDDWTVTLLCLPGLSCNMHNIRLMTRQSKARL